MGEALTQPAVARLDPYLYGKTGVEELPFGVRQVRGVSHPQCTLGMYLQSADKIAVLLRLFEFSNRL